MKLLEFYDEMSVFVVCSQFDDISMGMTLFVLFGDSIKLMTTPKWYGTSPLRSFVLFFIGCTAIDVGLLLQSDASFDTMNSICFVFFCIEFLLASWSKTVFESFNPLVYHGNPATL